MGRRAGRAQRRWSLSAGSGSGNGCKFQRQTLIYQKTLSDNVYFRNVNNNAGMFDYIIGEAEEQECKEAFLGLLFPARARRADRKRARPEHRGLAEEHLQGRVSPIEGLR